MNETDSTSAARLTPPQLAGLGAIALLAVVLRWLTRSPVVYNWDSVHYVLALDRYDILAHQPHPPGSYYYILLCRAARAGGGDPHLAVLAVSMLSGAGYVILMFALVRALGGGRLAWLAAGLGATAPLFWFYGSVGLNYGPAGVLSAMVAWGCVRACRASSSRGLVLAATALGVLGGFRPTDAVFLLPAYLWAAGVWAARGQNLPAGKRWGVPAGGLLLFAALSLGWLVPNIWNTGGLQPYLDSIRGQEHLLGRSSVLSSGWPALHEAWITHQRSLESALGVVWIGLALALGKGLLPRFRPGSGEAARVAASPADGALTLLGILIVVPAFLFYLLGHFNSPGYALTYAAFLGAVTLLKVGRLLGRERAGLPPPRGFPPGWIAVALVGVLGNAALFLAGWPGWGPLGQRSLSAREIQDHAAYYRDLDRFLRAHHPPGTVRLLASWNSTEGLRTSQYLLPDYQDDIAQPVAELPQLPPGFHSLAFLRMITPEMIRREGRPTYAIVRTWEDPPYHLGLFGRGLQPVPIGSGHLLYRIPLSDR